MRKESATNDAGVMLRPRKAAIIAGSMSGATQFFASATSFLITLYCVRALGKEEFGLYSTYFAAATVFAGLAGSLFVLPVAVQFGDQDEAGQKAAIRDNAHSVICVGLLSLVLACGLTWVFKPAGWSEIMAAVAATIFSACAFTVRDIYLRHFFYSRSAGAAAFTNAVAFLTVGGIIGVAYVTDHTVGWIEALICYAAGQAMAVFAAAQISRAGLLRPHPRALLRMLPDVWAAGRWSAASSVLFAMRTHAHVILLMPLGLAAIADANAAKVLIAPALVLIPVVAQVALPEVVRRRTESVTAMWKVTKSACTVLVGVIALYSAALLLIAYFGLDVFLGAKYKDASGYVVAWCTVALFLSFRNGLMLFLEGAKQFRDLFAGNATSVVVLLATSAIAVPLLGGVGSVYAIAMAEVSIAVVFAKKILQVLEK